MNDFVTLACPSCGGKFTVQKNTLTYTCQYCGQSHKLREEDIEFFGRCPKCHRNDRVEKLTAILNKHDQLANKFRPPENLKAVRFYPLLDSIKAEKTLDWILIDQKQESTFTKKSKLFIYGSLAAAITAPFLFSKNGSGFLTFLAIVLILGSLTSIVFAIINAIKGEQDSDKYQKEILKQKSIQTQIMRKRYDEIYYCHRDDTLFIPGEEGFAIAFNYEEFISRAVEIDQNAKKR